MAAASPPRSPLTSRETLLSTLTGGSAAAAAVLPGTRHPASPQLFQCVQKPHPGPAGPTHSHPLRARWAGRLSGRSGAGRFFGETDRGGERPGATRDGALGAAPRDAGPGRGNALGGGGAGGGRGDDADFAGGDLGFMEDMVRWEWAWAHAGWRRAAAS